MAVKLRLQRKGRKQAPFYHIVAADARAPRDGKYIEKIGTYNPLTQPATIELDADAAFNWLTKGAQPTDTVAAILRYKGVMLRKHLEGGVKKGALTAEQAAEKLATWLASKTGSVEQAAQKTAATKKANIAAMDGKVKAKIVKAPPVPEYVAPAVIEQDAPVVVETVVEAAPVVVETVVEAAPVVVETVVEAAPVVVETVVEAAPVVVETVVEAAPTVEEIATAVVEAKTEEA
jgi:small subunit ribosomal protein S16